MQYSLLSHFEGCLWGMVLGEQFGGYKAIPSNSSKALALQSQKISLQYWQPSLAGEVTQPLSNTAVQLLKVILQTQTWSLSVAQTLDRATWQNFSQGTFAIASLPLALLFHDDLTLQRQAVWQLMEAIQAPEEVGHAAITYAYAIAQAAKGHLNPRLLIDQTQAYLRVIGAKSTPILFNVLTQLEQIQQLQDREADLSTVFEILQAQRPETDPSIAIALYCFLQTPHSFQLSLQQASQVNNDCRVVCTLTAALSGTYNSIVGIPAAWNISGTGTSSYFSLSQMRKNAAQLLALWSGVYDASTLTEVKPLAVTAPWVLRSR